jgi:hypothetical protein
MPAAHAMPAASAPPHRRRSAGKGVEIASSSTEDATEYTVPYDVAAAAPSAAEPTLIESSYKLVEGLVSLTARMFTGGADAAAPAATASDGAFTITIPEAERRPSALLPEGHRLPSPHTSATAVRAGKHTLAVADLSAEALADAICDRAELPRDFNREVWRWEGTWRAVLDAGERRGDAFGQGLAHAARVETTRALNLVRRLGADKEVACRCIGVVARAASLGELSLAHNDLCGLDSATGGARGGAFTAAALRALLSALGGGHAPLALDVSANWLCGVWCGRREPNPQRVSSCGAVTFPHMAGTRRASRRGSTRPRRWGCCATRCAAASRVDSSSTAA